MTFEILFVLLALLGMVIALVLDKMRPGMVLFSVVVLFLCAGILTPKEMLEGFSNKGMMTVAMLFLVSELYFGVHDSGAYKLSGITARDGMSWDELLVKAVRLPETSVHERFVIVASRSHLTPETEDYIEKMKCSHAEVELISSGSSIKICLVAEGKADVYPRFAPTMEWDTAAGHAIARAAGMEIYQAGKEEPLQYNKEDLLNPWFIVEPKHTEIK